jgi:heme exporter protein D
MSQFLSMGGYAAYVWPAYGVAAVVLIAMGWSSVAAYRRTRRALDVAQAGRKKG